MIPHQLDAIQKASAAQDITPAKVSHNPALRPSPLITQLISLVRFNPTSNSHFIEEDFIMPAESTQTFSFETVAVLVATIKDKGGNLGMKDYELMASLDSSRSASGFDHLFRKVKARANELLEAKKNGNLATPTKKAKSPGGEGKKRTPAAKNGNGKKRGKKVDMDDELEDEESPTKKVKVEASDDGDHGLD